jgi:Rrf2 family protein
VQLAEIAMKLSRTIVYAIQATLHLARSKSGVPVPCSQLAREGRMPERFLLQILRTLVKQGVLKSTSGAAGGYYLSRSPRQISLCDIVEAFDNSLEKTMPLLIYMLPTARTQVAERLRAAAAATRAELQKSSVADLIREETDLRAVVGVGSIGGASPNGAFPPIFWPETPARLA